MNLLQYYFYLNEGGFFKDEGEYIIDNTDIIRIEAITRLQLEYGIKNNVKDFTKLDENYGDDELFDKIREVYKDTKILRFDEIRKVYRLIKQAGCIGKNVIVCRINSWPIFEKFDKSLLNLECILKYILDNFHTYFICTHSEIRGEYYSYVV